MRWFFSLPLFRGLRVGASAPFSSKRSPAPQPGVVYFTRAQMKQQNRNVLAIMDWRLDTRMYDGRTFREWYDDFDITDLARMMMDGRDRTFTMPDGRKLAKWTRAECEAFSTKLEAIGQLFGLPKRMQQQQSNETAPAIPQS